MIRLLLEECSGYRLYMMSDGFDKRFYVTDLNDVFAIWDGTRTSKGKMFDSIIEAAKAFEDCIYQFREEVRE